MAIDDEGLLLDGRTTASVFSTIVFVSYYVRYGRQLNLSTRFGKMGDQPYSQKNIQS